MMAGRPRERNRDQRLQPIEQASRRRIGVAAGCGTFALIASFDAQCQLETWPEGRKTATHDAVLTAPQKAVDSTP
jgi:hypothetical protein